jgi:hypothetical protein
MKGLLEIQAENAEIDKSVADRRKASIRRLKMRIARITRSSSLEVSRRGMRRQINEAIDAWAKAEDKR